MRVWSQRVPQPPRKAPAAAPVVAGVFIVRVGAVRARVVAVRVGSMGAAGVRVGMVLVPVACEVVAGAAVVALAGVLPMLLIAAVVTGRPTLIVHSASMLAAPGLARSYRRMDRPG